MNPTRETLTLAKRLFLSVVLILSSLLLAACGGADDGLPEEASVRPVKTFVVEGGAGGLQRRFPANVYASKRAELSFRVPGRVVELKVKEGDPVETGSVLARLDDADYCIAVQDRQA